MSQADELLESLSNDGIMALSADPSVEPHIVIDNDRKVTVPGQLRRIAVQYDHNIETVTFDCPRYWDGHDMSTMVVYINYKRPDGKLGSYIAENVTVDETDDTIMHFDWTVSKHTTSASGSLTFLVCIKKVDDEGEEVNHWNSELNTEMYISTGLEADSFIEELYPDIITQLLSRMDVVEDAADGVAANADKAAAYAEDAKNSASGVETYANEAAASAAEAKTSETNAAASAIAAENSLNSIGNSVDEAVASAAEAKTSETNAADSATAAGESASEASTSASNAAESERNASTYATTASNKALVAAASEANAKTSETNAASSASSASTSEANASSSAAQASESATVASTKATEASNSATNAAASESNAEDSAILSQSWAIGGTGTRSGEDTDNAKYWSEQAKAVVGGDFATVAEAQAYATTAEANSKSYADTLIADGDFASKSDAQGYADTAETNAKAYADTVISNGDFASKTDAQGYADTAEANAKSYADSLAAEDIDCGTW